MPQLKPRGASGKTGAPGRKDLKPAAEHAFQLGPLANYVGYALRRAQMAAVAGFMEVMQEVDLRPTQFAVLSLIHANPGVRQNDICAALGLQKANFVPLLNELERRGLALRKKHGNDRRASALHLTAAGRVLLRRALELHGDWENRILARVGAQGRDQLLKLLYKLM